MDIKTIHTTALAPQGDRRIERPVPPADTAAEAGKEKAAVQPVQPTHDEEQVTQALNSINELLKTRSPDLEFSVDRDSDRAIVKVVDKETQEVIRQMPSEDALQIAKALDRLQSMLIRETA